MGLRKTLRPMTGTSASMTRMVSRGSCIRSHPIQTNKSRCSRRTKLVLALVLRLELQADNVGNDIPGVVDTGEQEQKRSATSGEQRWLRIFREQYCRNDECGVGDERKNCMPQPVFQHRCIVRLAAETPCYYGDVSHSAQAAETEQQADIPEYLPGSAEDRGDEEREGKMHDVWRIEGRNRLTRPSYL